MPFPRAWLPSRSDYRALLDLAVPIVTVQVGMHFMGVVDALMVGRLSAAGLGAVALGNLFSMAITILAQGILQAVDPIVSQGVGAGDRPAIARGIQRGLVLAVLLTVPAAVLHLGAGAFLRLARQPAEIVPLADAYVRALIPGILAALVFSVGRQSLQAMGHLRPILACMVIGNLLNALLNWVFIFGNLGAPALGVEGSGIATSSARWLMLLALLWIARADYLPHLRPWHRDSTAIDALGRLLRLGLPIGLQWELELGAFGLAALLAGVFGTVQVAGHEIAINIAALTYMVPLGVSVAASVRVGQAVGREDMADARRQAVAAMVVGAGFMSLMAIVLLSAPAFFARLYTSDPQVIAVAAQLIPLAGLFQVFDGTQVTAIGALRGTGDTRTPFLVNLMGYWAIGIPVSLLLGFTAGMQTVGVWWGLVVGLAVVAVILVIRLRRTFSREVERLAI
jgi:MATE family multidrug resistance protein